ncbi:MAG: hypothetical protein AAGA75_06565 [Cyanobacteria bacterium P01_E01_bin.6]
MAFQLFSNQFPRQSAQPHQQRSVASRSNLSLNLQPGQKLVRGWAIALTGLVGGFIGLTVAFQPVQAEPRAANDGRNERTARC